MTHPTRAHSYPPSSLYIDQCIPDEPVRPAPNTDIFDDEEQEDDFDDNEGDNMPQQEMNNFVSAVTTESVYALSGSDDGIPGHDPSPDPSQGLKASLGAKAIPTATTSSTMTKSG
jgi:hypothetical protein